MTITAGNSPGRAARSSSVTPSDLLSSLGVQKISVFVNAYEMLKGDYKNYSVQ